MLPQKTHTFFMDEDKLLREAKKKFGRNFKLLRNGRKWSIDYTAGMLGVGRTTIQNWEKGDDFPEAWRAIKIADVFHVQLDWLFGRKAFICTPELTQQQNITKQINQNNP